ncbi:putative hyaluronan/mRNA-binding protein [Helianthus debilis subsp. tardiflorus]
MATMNPFDLLGGDDNDDPEQLVQKIVAAPANKAPAAAPAGKATAQPAKLPSKPLPPAQAVREARNEGGRGGRGGRGYGRGGRGSGGYNRDSANNEGSFGNHGIEESDGKSSERRGGGYGGPRGGFRGERRVSFANGDGGEDGERPRRTYERHSGTGRGNEFKREGAGRGNWGTQADEINQEIQEEVVENEKNVASDKPDPEEDTADVKNDTANERVEEPENKEMTLEEYQKVLEEKRKALEALKTEERKVEVDKELASMQQLSNKKTNDDIFVKLGSDKDKRKEIAEKEERAKKSLSINEFLKPAEGERYYVPGGRGRGRGSRGGGRFNQGGGSSYAHEAPKIEDPSHFPTLGGK